MNKTSIEWVKNPDFTGISHRDPKGRFQSQGYTWNPITGCLNHVNGLCKGGGFPCYAYRLANGRLKSRYLTNHNILPGFGSEKAFADPFYPRFWEEKLNDGIFSLGRKAKGIFVCDMGDLFGIGVPEDWTRQILAVCRMSCYQQHRFYLLTKQPQRLREFSPFPENCWVGVTATNQESYYDGVSNIAKVQAKVKFVSFEPLLEQINGGECAEEYRLDSIDEFDWLIIGACTGREIDMGQLADRYHREAGCVMQLHGNIWALQPRIEWLREIVNAADKAGVKVFLKNNLRPLLIPEDCSKPNYLHEDIFWASEKARLRQEMPDIREGINAQP